MLRVVDRLGETGVGLLTLLETVFPPIPSELILPLAGYLAQRGELSALWVFVAATLGSLAGAWILYWAGAAMGPERSSALLARLPLVDRRDVDRAASWFDRRGEWAVLLGRLIPGVRSLVSLPAGASRMPAARFTLFTLAGSALWNGLLVGAGMLLGTQYELVGRYQSWLDRAMIAAVLGAVAWLVVRRVRRERATQLHQDA